MKRLLMWLVVAVLLLVGGWMAVAAGLIRGIDTWLADRRAEGWAADVSTRQVTGFPVRWEVELVAPRIADPETGWSWSADEIWFEAPILAPLDVTFAVPPDHRLQTPGQRFTLVSNGSTGTLHLGFRQLVPLRSARFETGPLRIISDAGWNLRMRSGLMDIPATDDPFVRKLRISADGLRPPSGLFDLSAAAGLPETLEALAADLTITFDRPWDRRAIEEARPQPRRIVFDRVQAKWGQLDLRVAGTLEIDALGAATGDLQIKATNWRDILALGETSGLLIPELASGLSTALEIASTLAGHPETLDIVIGFRDGRLFFGPVPLGPAPVFRLR